MINNRAMKMFEEGNYGLAQYLFKRQCHSSPSYDSWYYRGLCFKHMGMYESSLYCWRKAVLHLDRISEEDDLLFNFGFSHYFIKNYDKALFYMKKSLENEQRPWLSRLIKLMCHMYMGQRNDFLDLYKSITRNDELIINVINNGLDNDW